MSWKRIIKGIIVLTMCIVVLVATMGATCRVKLAATNGHWVEHYDSQGNFTHKTCEPSGSECIILSGSTN